VRHKKPKASITNRENFLQLPLGRIEPWVFQSTTYRAV
jgi:hypothetical protein